MRTTMAKKILFRWVTSPERVDAIIVIASEEEMPSILIRGINVKTVRRLKARAAASGRSLQAEVKAILERSATEKTFDELRREAEEFSKKFEGRRLTDSVELIREDRNR